MSEIIAVTSPKGGCGATSVCAAIAYFMADKGMKTLAVDMCSGKCTLDFALGMHNDSVYDVSDVVSGTCRLDEAVCCFKENAFFLRGSDDEFDFENIRSTFSGFEFDYIFLDVPPHDKYLDFLNNGDIDKLILVTDCSQVSAKICNKYLGCYDNDKIYVIVNKIIPPYIERGVFPYIDEILDDIGAYPIGLIPWSFGMIVATASDFNEINSDEVIVSVFNNIARRISGEKVPAAEFEKLKIDIKNKKSFVNRNNRR